MPADTDSLLGEGVRALDAGHADRAEALFRQACAVDPARREIWRALGWARIGTENLVEACRALGRAYQIQPGAADGDLGLFRNPGLYALAQAVGDRLWDRAVTIAECLAELSGGAPDRDAFVERMATIAEALGVEAVAAGLHELGVRAHRIHARLRPDNPVGAVTLALAHLRAGHTVAAIRLMAEGAGQADGAWRLTSVNTIRRHFPDLLNAARRLFATDRRAAAAAYEGLAALAAASGEPAAPLAEFAAAAARLAAGTPAASDDPVWWEAAVAAHLGRFWLNRQAFDDAAECLNVAFALRADPADSAGLAVAHLGIAQGRLVEAIRAALSTAPGQPLPPERLDMAAGLIAALDRSLDLPLNSDANRSEMWSRLSSLEAWRRYAAITGRHPSRLPTQDNPALRSRSNHPVGAPKRRLFDCFPFFNELDLLELRLSELDGVVDRFVLVEADFTHTGQPKPLYFAENRERFATWADKITHIVVSDDPGGFAWRREFYQREVILRGLEECRPDDMILISDIDEIPRAEVAARLCDGHSDFDQFFAPELGFYYYRLDLKAPEPWRAVAAAPYHLLAGIGPNAARSLARQGVGQTIPNAGWHFTWMGDAARFLEKMRAYAHQEHRARFDADAGGHAARLERLFAASDWEPADIPGLRTDLQRVPIAEDHPRHVRAALDHYRRLGWIPP